MNKPFNLDETLAAVEKEISSVSAIERLPRAAPLRPLAPQPEPDPAQYLYVGVEIDGLERVTQLVCRAAPKLTADQRVEMTKAEEAFCAIVGPMVPENGELTLTLRRGRVT